VRLVLTVLLGVATTVTLALAIPAVWAQKTLVNESGYAALAQKAAHDEALQDAMASELTTQVTALAQKRGLTLDESQVHKVATVYTASTSFPGQFAQASRLAHRWAFNEQQSDSQGRWQVDLAPMLADTSFQETLSRFNIEVPTTLSVPVTAGDTIRPGQLQNVGRWGPWVAIAASVLAGLFALLTLVSARRRGKALVALGISALLVGAGGWAVLEGGRRWINSALNHTTGDVRTIADVMVANAEGSLHQWLNLTLVAGGGLVILGVIGALLGGLRRD
jgi:hypothetical protein